MPNVSKIFERCMFCQINEYMDVFLSDTNVVLERDTVYNNVSSPCLKNGVLL